MSVTGYERQFYNDVRRIADAIEQTNDIHELIRLELKKARLQLEALATAHELIEARFGGAS